MRSKLLTIFLFPLGAALLAGIYGILLNQFTYSISPEFFTKDMFYRFQFDDYFKNSERTSVTIVGFFSSWWAGFVIGLILSLVSLLFDEGRQRIKYFLKALFLVLACTLLTPLIIVSGWFLKRYFSQINYEQFTIETTDYAPEGSTILNPVSFYSIALVNNFSYLGGFIGLIAGIFFLIWKYKKLCQPGT